MSADKEKSASKFGSVAKLKMLANACSNPKLSRVELAVLFTISDMADANSGIAWPSYATIAVRSGSTSRHVKTAVKRLVAGGYLTIAQRGNRVRSNRYRIILDPPGGVLQNTTPHSDPQNTTVVLSSVTCGALERSDVVLPTAHESLHPSEPKASDGWEGSQADGGALRAPALRPALARQPTRGSDKFPEFWEAVNFKATVAEAERLLAELIADGVEYTDVLEGAKRWAAYNAATGGKKRASPLRWLQAEKWRDGWELPSARRRDRSGEGKPISQYSFAELAKLRAKTAAAYEETMWRAEEHTGPSADPYADPPIVQKIKCAPCWDVFHNGKKEEIDRCCSEGAKLVKKYFEARSIDDHYDFGDGGAEIQTRLKVLEIDSHDFHMKFIAELRKLKAGKPWK